MSLKGANEPEAPVASPSRNTVVNHSCRPVTWLLQRHVLSMHIHFRPASLFATCRQDQGWQHTQLWLTCRSDSCKPTCCMRSPSGFKEKIVPLTSHTMPFTLDQDVIGYARRATGWVPVACELRRCQGTVEPRELSVGRLGIRRDMWSWNYRLTVTPTCNSRITYLPSTPELSGFAWTVTQNVDTHRMRTQFVDGLACTPRACFCIARSSDGWVCLVSVLWIHNDSMIAVRITVTLNPGLLWHSRLDLEKS